MWSTGDGYLFHVTRPGQRHTISSSFFACLFFSRLAAADFHFWPVPKQSFLNGCKRDLSNRVLLTSASAQQLGPVRIAD